MKYIKPVLFTFVILTVVLCGYIYFRFDSGYALREAYTAYNIGNTQQAQEFLSILNKKSSAKYHLYSGLLMIDEKQYSKALSFFEEAAKINNNPSIQQEIEAALQLCYFLTGDLQNTALLNKSSCSLDYPRQLIKAWSFFKQSRYLEAKEIFEKLPSFEAGHPWLELAYNRYFPKTQIDLMRCHAMIESGEAFNAKQKLEELPQNFKEQSGYYHFLLGLSEIQEAKTRSLNLAIPYYQAAFQQFRKIAFYDPENLSFKSEVIAHYTQLIDHLLESSLYSELAPFLDILGMLNAKIDEISGLFFKHLQKEIQTDHKVKRLELVRQSLAYCYHSPFRDKLSESLYFYIEKLIKDRDVESVKKVWPIYTQIAANAENDQIAFAQTLSNDLKSLLTEKKLHVEPLKAILDLLSALDLPNSYTLEILDSFSLQNKQSEIFAKTVDQCLSSENNFDSAEQKINDFIIELDKQSHDSQKSELNP